MNQLGFRLRERLRTELARKIGLRTMRLWNLRPVKLDGGREKPGPGTKQMRRIIWPAVSIRMVTFLAMKHHTAGEQFAAQIDLLRGHSFS